MSKKNGGFAFPVCSQIEQMDEGMTLRDWFASQCLQGMHARQMFDSGLATPEQRARLAYIDADAMLKEREK